MTPKPLARGTLALVLAIAVLGRFDRSVTGDAAEPLPERWLAAWQCPAASDRPLQIVHGIDPRRVMAGGIDQMLHEQSSERNVSEGMRYYLDLGLGGIVCNVAFDDYMVSEPNWQTLITAVEQCDKLGLIVWLYDEQGYPSGAAGGLVLAENRDFEAMALAYDPAREDPFVMRPAYEHTHASNNYYAARRYANLIDERAVRSFLDKTHNAYWDRLRPFFGKTIQATFTDEPSLIAINLGGIPEKARAHVPVVDPVDPSVPALPCVPWCHDLPERYRQRHDEDLHPQRRSLFVGNTAADRTVRRRFWALISDLVAERYFGALQHWCADHRVASSGHSLWEEHLLHHVALEGNGLKALSRMDVPGLDMLSSDPATASHSGWMTAALPASAARLDGRRRIMTEVSDFSQKMGGAGPAGLAAMQATAAWQAAWGVTEFTLYYAPTDRSAGDFRAYCDYVGRLNALLRPAECLSDVLLYYPIYDLWSEYLPVGEPMRLESQSPRAQQIVRSFMQLGQTLQRGQVPFTLVDHERLADAEVQSPGRLVIGNQSYRTIVLPETVELPPAAARVVDAMRQAGGLVVAGPLDAADPPSKVLQAPYHLAPSSEWVALGRFVRDGREILLLVNVGREEWSGHLVGDLSGHWQRLDPATASIDEVATDPSQRLALKLAPYQAILLVGGPPRRVSPT